jgi:hypothetical protein
MEKYDYSSDTTGFVESDNNKSWLVGSYFSINNVNDPRYYMYYDDDRVSMKIPPKIEDLSTNLKYQWGAIYSPETQSFQVFSAHNKKMFWEITSYEVEGELKFNLSLSYLKPSSDNQLFRKNKVGNIFQYKYAFNTECKVYQDPNYRMLDMFRCDKTVVENPCKPSKSQEWNFNYYKPPVPVKYRTHDIVEIRLRNQDWYVTHIGAPNEGFVIEAVEFTESDRNTTKWFIIEKIDNGIVFHLYDAPDMVLTRLVDADTKKNVIA